ncbi:hypothetical protein HDU80_008130 [Chytriomyces hyalinus]|nr:hypothetical protein HDU80_008130 [Chytriomyces hyalinus]
MPAHEEANMSPIHQQAIAAFENAVIASVAAEPQPNESRESLVSRCLAANGNMALTIAVKQEGGEIAWSKAYGIHRNGQALQPAAEKNPSQVRIHIPKFCTNPEMEEEWREYQLSIREGVLADAMSDTDESVGVRSKMASVTVNTSFQAASIGKPITAIAVLRLVQKGQLNLDADIASYLGGVWKLESKFELAEPITLRKLLGHAAGVSGSGFNGYNRNAVRSGKLSLPSTIGVLNGEGNSDKVEVVIAPNLGAVYSGGGTTIVQLVMETVTGKSMQEIITEELVEPLGLLSTSCAFEDINQGDFVCGHTGTEGLPLPGGYRIYPETAAAGIWSSALDLCMISDAVWKSWNGRLVNGATFLDQSLAIDMLTPRFPDDSKFYYGIGWELKKVGGSDQFRHSGWNEGFRSGTYTFIDSGAGYSWILSGEVREQVQAGLDALDVFYKFPIEEKETSKKEETAEIPPSALIQCVGEYLPVDSVLKKRDGGVKILVALSDSDQSALVFRFGSISDDIVAKATKDDVFKFDVFKSTAAKFTVTGSGKVKMMFGDLLFEKSG